MNTLLLLTTVACASLVLLSADAAIQLEGSSLVTGELPTDAEIEELLKDKKTVTDIVDCLVAIDFDDLNCDLRLKRAHSLAVEFFTNNQECPVPKCTEYETRQVKRFIRRLQELHRSEFLRLVQKIMDRSVYYDYNYDYDYE